MGIKIKNLQTGEFEKFNIPALKGEKGEPGEIELSEKVDYIGKQHSKLRDTMNANVDYIIKTAIGEFNYLDYEGQHITATNSIEGHARSAILSGQTLVNIVKPHSPINTRYTQGVTSAYQSIYVQLNFPLKTNTTYTIQMKVTANNGNPAFSNIVIGRSTDDGDAWSYRLLPRDFTSGARTTGFIKSVFTTPNITKTNPTHIIFISENNIRDNPNMDIESTIEEIMIVEGNYMDINTPYFTGMTSCKMPVLTTIGKNLFDGVSQGYYLNIETRLAGITSNDSGAVVDVSSINKATVSSTTIQSRFRIACANTLPKRGEGTVRVYNGINLDGNSSTKATIDCSNYKYLIVNATDLSIIQVEQGSTATPYEPYKSNILSTPKEVVLRSLPNGVKDTLNLNTGEYVQRIGETTFNGSEHWTLGTKETDNTIRFKTVLQANIPADNEMLTIISDNFPVLRNADIDVESVQLWGSSKDFNVRILKTKASTVDEFKSYLSQNPLTIQYPLATPVIKTVDLSDNHIYSYKGITHYSCSSEDGSLVPTLSVKVPTDTQLTIQEQKATTQTLLIKNMDLQQSIKEVQAMNLAFNTALYNSFNSIREEVEDIKKHVSTNENLEGSF